MSEKKDVRNMQFAVIGLGRFGAAVAMTLAERGAQVLAIDNRAEKVQAIANVVLQAVQIDATDMRALKSVGIGNFDHIIVGVGSLEPSILIILNLLEISGLKITAKATSEMHVKVLKKIGITDVVFPEHDTGRRMGINLVSPNILEYFELSKDYSIVEIEIPEGLQGKTIGGSQLRSKFGINVIAVKTKNGDKVHPAPGADRILEKNDVLVVVGDNQNIELFKKSLL